LKSVDIIPAFFNQHRELIIERLFKIIDDENLAENIKKELSDITRKLIKKHLDIANSIYYYRNLAEKSEEEFSYNI
jgi:hypothetical protein